jgi:hypothetical protein
MDWQEIIEQKRQALLAIVAGLYAMIELAEGGMIERIKRPLRRMVLKLLRPAESAVRRLIVMAARDLKGKPRAARPAPKGLKIAGKGKGRQSFPLFDRRVRYDLGFGRRSRRPKAEPHIRRLDDNPFYRPTPPPPREPVAPPDDTINAMALCRRLAAALGALKDLPRQARRYARWRDKPFEERRPKLVSTLRPGPPPGLSRTSSHEVHEILRDCHWFAHLKPKPAPDTS